MCVVTDDPPLRSRRRAHHEKPPPPPTHFFTSADVTSESRIRREPLTFETNSREVTPGPSVSTSASFFRNERSTNVFCSQSPTPALSNRPNRPKTRGARTPTNASSKTHRKRGPIHGLASAKKPCFIRRMRAYAYPPTNTSRTTIQRRLECLAALRLCASWRGSILAVVRVLRIAALGLGATCAGGSLGLR
jgi:hypothetical protein